MQTTRERLQELLEEASILCDAGSLAEAIKLAERTGEESYFLSVFAALEWSDSFGSLRQAALVVWGADGSVDRLAKFFGKALPAADHAAAASASPGKKRDEPSNDRERVLTLVRQGRYRDALGVSSSASQADVSAAHLRLSAKFKGDTEILEALNTAKAEIRHSVEPRASARKAGPKARRRTTGSSEALLVGSAAFLGVAAVLLQWRSLWLTLAVVLAAVGFALSLRARLDFADLVNRLSAQLGPADALAAAPQLGGTPGMRRLAGLGILNTLLWSATWVGGLVVTLHLGWEAAWRLGRLTSPTGGPWVTAAGCVAGVILAGVLRKPLTRFASARGSGTSIADVVPWAFAFMLAFGLVSILVTGPGAAVPSMLEMSGERAAAPAPAAPPTKAPVPAKTPRPARTPPPVSDPGQGWLVGLGNALHSYEHLVGVADPGSPAEATASGESDRAPRPAGLLLGILRLGIWWAAILLVLRVMLGDRWSGCLEYTRSGPRFLVRLLLASLIADLALECLAFVPVVGTTIGGAESQVITPIIGAFSARLSGAALYYGAVHVLALPIALVLGRALSRWAIAGDPGRTKLWFPLVAVSLLVAFLAARSAVLSLPGLLGAG